MGVIPNNIICEAELKSELETFLSIWFSKELIIDVYTSGSTGKPQQIQLLKSGVQLSAQNTIQYFGLNESTKALLCLPLSTIGGKMMVIRALECKMNLSVQKPTLNPLNNMNQTYDFVAVTPMQLNNMLNDFLSKLKNISTILVGGAPIHAELENRLKKERISVFHSYGMTETASHVALRRVGFNGEKYYKALPGISFETSVSGNLIVHYPKLLEYPIETTDQVKLIDKHTFEWVGRADFVINSGGVKMHPEEIESKITEQIGNPFFITGIPDEVLGERVVLVIETLNHKVSFDFEFLGKEKPREVFFVERLVYTKVGKLDRNASRKLILSQNR